MKALILALCLVPLAHADEASKMAKIEEMLALTHADRVVQQMLAQMQPMMANQMRQINLPEESRPAAEEMQKRIMALTAEKLSWDKLKPAYVKAYAETFTETEISGAIEFYKSPAGQAILDKMPQLLQKTMMLTQGLVGDLMPEITKMQQELSTKYKK